MNVTHDPDSILAAWLDEGPTDLPDATRRAILTALPTTSQARRGPLAPRRFPLMNFTTRLAAAALVAVVVVIGGTILLSSRAPAVGGATQTPVLGSGAPTPSTSGPAATTQATAAANGPLAVIPVRHDAGLVFAFGSLWIGDQASVQKIDPSTNTPTVIPFAGATIDGVRATATAISVSTQGGELSIDPSTNAATAAGPEGMPAYSSNWRIDSSGTLLKFDPATGKQTGSIPVQGTVDWQPQLVADFGSIWIAEGDTRSLVRVDPAGPRIVTRITGFSTDYSLFSIGSGFGSIWVHANAAHSSGILYRVDPATNKIIATIDVGDPAYSTGYGGTIVAFSDNAVWTADSSPTITRVDPATDKVVAVRHISLPQEWIAFGAGSLWVRNQAAAAVQRYDAAAWGP